MKYVIGAYIVCGTVIFLYWAWMKKESFSFYRKLKQIREEKKNA